MELRDITRSERRALLEDLHELTETDWSTVTVCDPWTVRQLVAHLTSMGNQTRWNFFTGLVRKRGDIDAFLGHDMRRYDTGSNADVLAAFERTVEEDRDVPIPAFVPPSETLVHADDIRRAVGRPRRPNHDNIAAIAPFYAKSGPPVRGKKRVRDLRLVATDGDWSLGDGPEVAGPGLDLLLATSGRASALDHCTGDGVAILRSRCT